MSPVSGLGQVSDSILFKWELFIDNFVKDSFFNATSSDEIAQEGLLFGVFYFVSELIVLRLREGIHSFVVARIILLFLGSFVRYGDSPGIDGGGPLASSLETHNVFTSTDSSEPIFSPSSSPRVSKKPVISASFRVSSITNNTDCVVEVLS
jgi:hypothetical protein